MFISLVYIFLSLLMLFFVLLFLETDTLVFIIMSEVLLFQNGSWWSEESFLRMTKIRTLCVLCNKNHVKNHVQIFKTWSVLFFVSPAVLNEFIFPKVQHLVQNSLHKYMIKVSFNYICTEPM